jgi:hypothetical protein
MSCHVGHLLDIDVDLSSGVGTPSLLDASLPRTPTGARDTPGAPSTPGHHVSGLTHELRASLPSGPLTSWSFDDVSTCLRVLGRNFHNEGNATDVSVFDTAAESCGLDGTQLVGVTGDSLRALGFARYDHRASIMDWVRQHLEVRPDLALPSKKRFGVRETHSCAKNFFQSHFSSRVAAHPPRPSRFRTPISREKQASRCCRREFAIASSP